MSITQKLLEIIDEIAAQNAEFEANPPFGRCTECGSPLDVEFLCINPDCEWYTKSQVVDVTKALAK